MQHPDEGLIHAWLDGALPADEALRLEAHVASCEACSALVAEARGLIAATSRIVGHLDAVPGGVIPVAANTRRRWLVRTSIPAAIAATLILGVSIYTTRSDTPTTLPAPDTSAPIAGPLERSVSPVTTQPERVASSGGRPGAPPPVAAVGGTATGARDAVDLVTPRAPAPATALQKSEATVATSPTAGTETRSQVAEVRPDPASRTSRGADPRLSSVAVTRADVVELARRNRSAVAAAPPSVAAAAGGGVSMADRAELSALTAFVGCYEMNVSTDILPARFALLADSAGPSRFEVRYLDANGRPSERILDAFWETEGGRAVIRTTGRGIVLTLGKTGSAVTADSPNGPRSGRVLSCR